MSLNDGMFTSNSDEWATPKVLFNALDKRFHFTLDAAASPENALCAKYYTMQDDGLSKSWDGEVVWCNPPYSKLPAWAGKFASEAILSDCLIVALVPARTDTRWWQDIKKADHIHFIQGRLKFGNSQNSAPFPSALAFFLGMNRIFRSFR